jgi:streptogramin lyase
MSRRRHLMFWLAAAGALGATAPSGAQTITYFPIPTANAEINGMTLGPDGNVWFTEQFANKIGFITSTGAITEFPIPTTNSFPSGITAGPDGNLWFFEANPGNIGRITTAGVVTEFPTPHGAGNGFQGAGIAAGSDGALWFTEATTAMIGRITLSGTVSEFAIPTANSSPRAIAAGPDGALWFTESAGNQIGRITTAGAFTEFAVPTAKSAPLGIAAGSDGAIWFTERAGHKIGRANMNGVMTEFEITDANSTPQGITAGHDGALWFAEPNGNNIDRVTTTNTTISETPVQGGCTPTALIFDNIGNLYFNCTNSSLTTDNVVGIVAPPICETLTLIAPGFANPTGPRGGNDPDPKPTCGPSPADVSLECQVHALCHLNYAFGDFPEVARQSGPGSHFVGWTGDCTSSSDTCGPFHMTAPHSETANYALNPTDTVSVVVSGRGKVTSSPPGLTCGESGGQSFTACVSSFDTGSQVTLTATADPDEAATFPGWGGICTSSATGPCTFTASSDQIISASFTQGTANPTPPVSAVLPVSQGSSAQAPAPQAGVAAAGAAAAFSTATVFATVINTATVTATDCAIQPTPSIPGSFTYQTTNPATNALSGTANTPVSIAAGAAQSFVIAITPDVAIAPTPLSFTFACANVGAAQIITDLNTLLFSASTIPVPNIIALGATATNDQILHISGTTGSNAFAVATFNLGSSDTVTVQPDTGAEALPLTLSMCQTNPASGQCTSAIGSTVSTTIAPNATPTFALFATAQGAIPLYPQANRIFVRFFDSSGQPRGATSVAVVAQ